MIERRRRERIGDVVLGHPIAVVLAAVANEAGTLRCAASSAAAVGKIPSYMKMRRLFDPHEMRI
jgi:hypothetical protein